MKDFAHTYVYTDTNVIFKVQHIYLFGRENNVYLLNIEEEHIKNYGLAKNDPPFVNRIFF